MKTTFTIPGEPVGKGRPRFSTKTGRTFTPEKTANYETLVKLSYSMQVDESMVPPGEPIEMSIKAYFSIPKSASKKAAEAMRSGATRPTKKPDMDNIIKIIADALNGIAYHDDSQIVSTHVEKFYADQPRVEIEISNIK